MSESPHGEELLTPQDVATWLKVTPGWVRAHANNQREPKLPSLKIGAYHRFRRSDIQSFLEELAKGRTDSTDGEERIMMTGEANITGVLLGRSFAERPQLIDPVVGATGIEPVTLSLEG